jgi:hypothetical protein
LVFVVLLLAACADHRSVAVEIQTDSVADFSAALILRLPDCRTMATVVSPAGLWNDLGLPAGDIAIFGYDSPPGPWRVPFAEMTGAAPSRNRPPLESYTRVRLDRFLRDVRKYAAVLQAPPELRAVVTAAHATRALATDTVARKRAKVTFVFLDARAPGLAPYCADAARDLALLTGRAGATLIWLRDARPSSMMACGAAARRLTSAPGRADVIAVLSSPRP